MTAGDRRSLTLRFLAAPMDANYRGYVGGGKILEWIDKAAYACAVAWSGHYCVTAYVGNIHFNSTINVGDLVEVNARVVFTGTTSMQIVCTVTGENQRSGKKVTTTQCLLVFVAMGDDNKPTSVPPFEPRDDWERAEHARAVQLTQVRKEIEASMAEQVYSEATETWRETLRFLAEPSDQNWSGKVHGGFVMHWIMTAGKIVAERWCHGHAKATYAGGFRFYRPMFIGDLVEVDARLIHTEGAEMHVSVHVRTGDPRGDLQTTVHCIVVYTAKDEHDEDVDVRPWVPRLPEDRGLELHARDLIEIRRTLGRGEPHVAVDD